MCLPTNTEISASGFRSTLGLGALMLVACLAGPVLAGVIGALGVGVLLGVGGAVVALAYARWFRRWRSQREDALRAGSRSRRSRSRHGVRRV
jgi:membrane associated rhomboid family serine protease